MVRDRALSMDRQRYANGRLPAFQYYYRKAQASRIWLLRRWYSFLFYHACKKFHIEWHLKCLVGEGLYFGHPYGITINPQSIIGRNVNIHKGVTIGQENRGKRKGAPTIHDNVWLGVNSTIVGRVTIGSDVLIAPNSYVNCDVPDHSIVFGNPCIIKPCMNATENYINRTV